MSVRMLHIQRLMDAMNTAWSTYGAPGATFANLRAAHEASAAVRAAQDAARDEFAIERGWLVAKSEFTVDQLRRGSNVRRRGDSDWRPRPIDHPQYFRLPECRWRPIGIVSHEYSPFPDSLAFADREGLIAELLPASWYSPSRCNAVLYTARLEPVGAACTPTPYHQPLGPIRDSTAH